MEELKPIIWIGSSRKDLRDFPAKVQKDIGDALQQIQRGLRPKSVKTLSGFGGASVLEIREDYDTDTYRTVYTVRFAERIYVLHAFQKKSHHGTQTAKHDAELIQSRLNMAAVLHRELNMTRSENKER
ncbi:MAG: type II toxin-antitoxin system RelE/ParE family toxin [Janthinobacterium lividum]